MDRRRFISASAMGVTGLIAGGVASAAEVSTPSSHIFSTVSDMLVGNDHAGNAVSFIVGDILTTLKHNADITQNWEVVGSGAGDMSDGTLALTAGLYAKYLHGDSVSTKAWGAYANGDLADGTIGDDDDKAIQSLIDYASENNLKVIISAGTHRTTSQLDIRNNNAQIEGEGVSKSAIFNVSTDGSIYAISVWPASNVSISSLTIQSTRAPHQQPTAYPVPLRTLGVNNSVFRDIKLIGGRHGWWYGELLEQACHNNNIENIHIEGANIWAFYLRGLNSTDGTRNTNINNLQIHDCNVGLVCAEGPLHGLNINNVLVNNCDTPLHIEKVSNVNIANGIFRGSESPLWNLNVGGVTPYTGQILCTYSHDVNFVNCEFSPAKEIRLYASSQHKVDNITFVGCKVNAPFELEGLGAVDSNKDYFDNISFDTCTFAKNLGRILTHNEQDEADSWIGNLKFSNCTCYGEVKSERIKNFSIAGGVWKNSLTASNSKGVGVENFSLIGTHIELRKSGHGHHTRITGMEDNYNFGDRGSNFVFEPGRWQSEIPIVIKNFSYLKIKGMMNCLSGNASYWIYTHDVNRLDYDVTLRAAASGQELSMQNVKMKKANSYVVV